MESVSRPNPSVFHLSWASEAHPDGSFVYVPRGFVLGCTFVGVPASGEILHQIDRFSTELNRAISNFARAQVLHIEGAW